MYILFQTQNGGWLVLLEFAAAILWTRFWFGVLKTKSLLTPIAHEIKKERKRKEFAERAVQQNKSPKQSQTRDLIKNNCRRLREKIAKNTDKKTRYKLWTVELAKRSPIRGLRMEELSSGELTILIFWMREDVFSVFLSEDWGRSV